MRTVLFEPGPQPRVRRQCEGVFVVDDTHTSKQLARCVLGPSHPPHDWAFPNARRSRKRLRTPQLNLSVLLQWRFSSFGLEGNSRLDFFICIRLLTFDPLRSEAGSFMNKNDGSDPILLFITVLRSVQSLNGSLRLWTPKSGHNLGMD